MTWDIIYLTVHVVALMGMFVLFRKTPDTLQFAFLCLLMFSGGVYLGADVFALMGNETVWPIRLIASRFEHTAVLLYLLRQVWIKTNICQSLKQSSLQGTSRS